MQPGEYDLIIYTHEAVTNMDSGRENTLTSFDLLLQLSVRLLRLADQNDGAARGAGVPIEILITPVAQANNHVSKIMRKLIHLFWTRKS
jgi:hypothetical protein